LPVSRDNASVLSYLCSQHLTGPSSVGFGKLSAIVLQLQPYKENKWHHSLLPPDPGPAAPRQWLRVSVLAVLFGARREGWGLIVGTSALQMSRESREHGLGWRGGWLARV